MTNVPLTLPGRSTGSPDTSASSHRPAVVNSTRKTLFWDIIDFLAVVNLAMALLFVSAFFVTILNDGPSLASEAAMDDRQSGNAVLQALTLVVYGPAIVFLLARLDRVAMVLRNAWPYFLLIALAVGSVLWSVEPQISSRRAIALLLSAIYVLHVVTWFDARRLLRLFAMFCAVMIIASAFAVLVPGVGITPADAGSHAGRWRGILITKNHFGVLAGVSCLTFASMYLTSVRGSRERQIWAGLAVLGLVELYFANSRTPLLGVIAAFALMWTSAFLFAPTARQQRIGIGLRSLIVGAGAFASLVILPALVAIILPLLGRDLTLSGRVKLWEYALDKGLDRFWLGAGYRSFWVDKLTFDLVTRQRYWGVPGQTTKLASTGHNGFLDIWLELGMVGLVLMLALFVMILVRANRFLRQTRDLTFLWYIGIFAYAFVYYMANGFILKHDDVAWFTVAYAITSLATIKVARPRLPIAQPLTD